MQADVFTRVVLVLILACLAALVAGQLGVGGEASRDATRGRYAITLARQGGNLLVLRTDTHTGEVSHTTLKGGEPWEVLGASPMEREPSAP